MQYYLCIYRTEKSTPAIGAGAEVGVRRPATEIRERQTGKRQYAHDLQFMAHSFRCLIRAHEMARVCCEVRELTAQVGGTCETGVIADRRRAARAAVSLRKVRSVGPTVNSACTRYGFNEGEK